MTFLNRLWGNHGQSNLESSRICLINATAAGTEALKSMVLPGDFLFLKFKYVTGIFQLCLFYFKRCWIF